MGAIKKSDRNSSLPGDEHSALAADRVLVVDDEEGIRIVVSEALSRVGYEVKSVESAQEALEAYDQFPVDAIISDWVMPGMNGIELVNRLKTKDANIAAILMTGYGTKDTVIEAFTRGKIDYYLSKPFNVDNLLETVSAAVKERRMALSRLEFRKRLEIEIRRSTSELKHKNLLLQQKHSEIEALYHELQDRQNEVERTKDYLENLIESSMDGIISLDNDNRIGFFSRGAEELFGAAAGDMVGRAVERIFVRGQSELDDLLEEAEEQGRLKHYQTEVLTKTGQSLMVDISVSTLFSEGGRQGLLLIIKDIAEHKRLEQDLRATNQMLEKLSITDGLTGLFNHRHFQHSLREELKRAERFQTPLSLIMLDLDDFKVVNDTLGHPTGDKVLILLGEIIRASIREVDIPARYGGEEFSVILPQTGLDDAAAVAARIRESIENTSRFQEIEPGLEITASLGLSAWPDPKIQTASDLVRMTDNALLKAKKLGKNRVVLGSSSGDRPLGIGDEPGSAEKKIILRRIENNLRGTLDLDTVAEYLLVEIAAALRQTKRPPPLALMLLDETGGLKTTASLGSIKKHINRIIPAAEEAVKSKAVQIYGHGEKRGPAAAFPILIRKQNRKVEIVGAVAMGLTPPEPEFFQDLVEIAAMGLLNAKLHQQVRFSQNALEQKLGRLINLAEMDLALQQNLQSGPDNIREGKRILADYLAGAGFNKVFVYEYDAKNKALVSGIGQGPGPGRVIKNISLAGLDKRALILKTVNPPEGQKRSQVSLVRAGKKSSTEAEIMRAFGPAEEEKVLARLSLGHTGSALVVVRNQSFSQEEIQAVSMFVLHASLIMDNMELSRRYRDMGRRLTLIYEIGQSLANSAASCKSLKKAAPMALTELAAVLQVSEISLYTYQSGLETMELFGYESGSAGKTAKPASRVKIKDCPVMARLTKNALEKEKFEPLVIENISSSLKVSPRKRFATNVYLGIPLVFDGRYLGLMNVTDKLDRSYFTPQDVHLARIIGGVLSLLLFKVIRESEVEQDTFEAIDSLANVVEVRQKGQPKGHYRRVIRLTENLAMSMGLSGEEAARISRAVWLNTLSGQDFDDESGMGPLQACCRIMGSYLDRVGPYNWGRVLARPGTPKASGPPEQYYIKATQAAAEAFVARYLDLRPQERPNLADVLMEIIEQTPRIYQPEVVKALTGCLLIGVASPGRKKIIFSARDRAEMKKRLSQTSGKKSAGQPAAALAKKLLELIREHEKNL